jgi:hypothetical protein
VPDLLEQRCSTPGDRGWIKMKRRSYWRLVTSSNRPRVAVASVTI